MKRAILPLAARWTAGSLALAAAAFAQTTGPPSSDFDASPRTAPFDVLDNVEGAGVDLLFAPIRPLVVDDSTGTLFALNGHDSAVQVFDGTGQLVRTIRVPWGPVSIALWEDSGEKSLLVVMRGTYTLARIDLTSGDIVALFDLATEPADIVVHPTNNHAFVSCAGAGVVQEIDVAAGQLVRSYPIPSEMPTFLTLEGNDVLVAPMISGNNSIAKSGNLVLAADGRVLDLEDPAIASQPLPDHDLFRISPGVDPLAIATDMGAVLFAVGVNPSTGDIWQLGTEANNKNPNLMGEPAIRGEIVFNQVALSAGGSIAPLPPYAVINLDDTDPGTPGIQYDPGRTVGQPYGLDFDAAGNGYVTGLLTDNVTQLDSTGAFVREWDVGSVPRAVLLNAAGDRAWVHCWGTNTVELYDLAPQAPLLLATLDLGFDPTSALRQEGRRLFYDGDFSLHNNASCNSCHIEGASDMLVWDLSNLPFDDKGPLTTQTLVGIADLAPMHWRGERADLIDFNGAFDGLLGGSPLDVTEGGDFDAFQAFLFSLEQPANPNQHPERLLDGTSGFTIPGGQHFEGDAIRGQQLFSGPTSVAGVGSCNVCHQLPTGTNNDIVLDDPDLEEPRRNHRVVASFNGIWRKEQPTLETIVFADNSEEEVPTIGPGLVGTGVIDHLFEFVSIPLFTGINAQDRQDITSFISQMDSGLAPAAHKAWLLGGTSTLLSALKLQSYLLPQAEKRNVDVVVFGMVDFGQGPRDIRWFWDRDTGLFVPERSTISPQPLSFFVNRARGGLAANVFMGVPVGMGERFGVDFDGDDLKNQDEELLGTDPFNADTDDDGDPDGHEVANGGDPLDDAVQSADTTAPVIENLRLTFVTRKVAKIQFDTAEPTRYDAAWTLPAANGGSSSNVFEKNHTVLLRDLTANKSYTVTLTVTDLGGNSVQADVPGVVTEDFVFPFETVFRNADVTVNQNSGGTLDFTVAGRARRKGGGGAANHQLRVQVFVNGVASGSELIGTNSPNAGDTQVTVHEDGLSPGDEVRAVVTTLFSVPLNTRALWSMGDTRPDFREFIVEYDGMGP